ncbi:MAG: hypothetical protein K9L68_04435 [Spirochaetales bacterium]|nr:hypothetical protein [Spirochaetales bacterium]MCF7937825.1 hypothetical protein [Spirochaetales bacterium]
MNPHHFRHRNKFQTGRRLRPAAFAAFLLIPLLLLGFSCCSRNDEAASTSHSLEEAKLISHASSGYINTTDTLKLRFVAPPPPETRNKIANEGPQLISFDPDFTFAVNWEDEQTLRIVPATPLETRTAYSGKLALNELFSEKAADPFRFEFTTTGRELARLDAEFVSLKDAGSIPGYSGSQTGESASMVIAAGIFSFTTETELKEVKKAFSLLRNGARLPADIERGPEDNFRFYSKPIPRTEATIVIAIDGDRLDLSGNGRKELRLLPSHQFSLTKAETVEGEEPGYLLSFSDELSRLQNLSGFLRTEPPKELHIRKFANKLHISGDFEHGKDYLLTVEQGIRSIQGSKTENTVTKELKIQDIKPRAAFLQSGVFLPSGGDGRIHFKTVNLRSVKVEVKRVFENNLGQFLQTEQINSSADRTDSFRSYYVNRVGVSIAEDELELEAGRNKWRVHELDISELIGEDRLGLYLVRLSFDKEDMIWDFEETGEYYYGEDYYSNPNSPGYIYHHGSIYKPVIESDIGLSWKQGTDSVVTAMDLKTANPLQGVRIELRSYQNQLIASGSTDEKGMVRLPETGSEEVFYVTGEYEGRRTVIKANEMRWSTSSFSVGGVEAPSEKTRAFLYTERGIYRPGDTIHLCGIFRNSDGGFPDGHPVELKVTNPRDRLVYEKTVTNGREGFYRFDIPTGKDDPTGTWRAEITAGSAGFSRNIPVEMIVPNRLEVDVDSSLQRVEPDDRFLDVEVNSSYLFGAPSSGLPFTLNAVIEHRQKQVERFPGFFFDNQSVEYPGSETPLAETHLDASGRSTLRWELPPFKGAPSALSIRLRAEVIEPGGRSVAGWTDLPVDPYRCYAGIEQPDLRYGYARIGEKLQLPAVAVDREGKAAPGRRLEYRVYRIRRYWWWEYESHRSFRLRYKSDSDTELVREGRITSGTTPALIGFTPESGGEYLVELEDPGGHTAGIFLRASSWGRSSGGDEGLLSLRTDRESYRPGQTARISFPSPPQGTVLVSIEQADRILDVYHLRPQKEETTLTVEITEEMIPTAYVTVSLLQPYRQTLNDRPIRMYGIVPLNVSDPKSRRTLEIQTDELLEPNSDFRVSVQTGDGEPAQLTLAVVDEGLLDLTAFETPDPWASMYAKQRLLVSSYDVYSQVIGSVQEDIFRTFAIGGSEALRRTSSERSERRFDPVSLIKGPRFTDRNGRAEFTFSMPNYMGSVRLMAVAASGERYGKAETIRPVRDELVLLPTLPRSLRPGTSFTVPVTVFSTRPNHGAAASVRIKTEGGLEILGTAQKEVKTSADGPGSSFSSGETSFRLAVLEKTGKAAVRISGTSGSSNAGVRVPLEIHPVAPHRYESERKTVEPGGAVEFSLPENGLEGTMHAAITVSKHPPLEIRHRLGGLVRYPYGCLEQTVSAAFPQLSLQRGEETNSNIREAIEKLRRFQLPSGAFSFWPGGNTASLWNTNYAGHFLLTAKQGGFQVPQEMMENWIRYQSSRAISGGDGRLTQTYRLYLLSLAGKPAAGPMNLLAEREMQNMEDLEKRLLAAAYSISGRQAQAERILRTAGTRAQSYHEFSGTYGSQLRDQAMMLDLAVQTGALATADRLFEIISERLSSDDWLSTQTTAFSLLAAGNYLDSLGEGSYSADSTSGESGRLMEGTIILQDGERLSFSTRENRHQVELDSGFGGTVRVEPAAGSESSRLFVTLEWEGVPRRPEQSPVAKNLNLTTRWLDRNGTPIDISALSRGEELWGHIRVDKPFADRRNLEELVCSQWLPAGWEPDIWRQDREDLPAWAENMATPRLDYLDIRDDRVDWFFDMPPGTRSVDLLFRLRTVSAGSFHLPPTECYAMYRKEDYRARGGGGPVRVLPE